MSDQQTLVLLSGGLDTQSPNIAAPKGTLRDCLNYEVGTQAGYSRIGGWMPHDGTVMGPAVADFVYMPIPFSGWNGDDFVYAEQVSLSIISGEFVGTLVAQANCIGWSSPNPGIDGVLIVSFTPAQFSDAFYLALSAVVTANGAFSGASVSFGGGVSMRKVSDGLLTPLLYSAYRSNVEMRHVAEISPVPGSLLSPPDGVFTYKDRDYAVHDCIAFYFKQGTNGLISEGHIVKTAAGDQLGIVLSITVTAGSWAGSTAEGYLVVYDQPDGVSFPADGTNLDLWTADGVANLGMWARFDGTKSYDDLKPLTRALLYSAENQPPGEAKSPNPWTRRRLCRELGYTQIGAAGSIGFGPDGDADYSIYEYSRLGLNQQNQQLQPVTTAYKFCQSPAQNATAWTNLTNIQAQDGNVATCLIPGGYSTIMKALSFDFSEIPQGSVITGFEVVIRRRANTSATSTRDDIVRLALPDGTFSPNKANAAIRYPIVLTDAVYGDATDTWGIQLSRDMLNDPAFGVHFQSLGTAGDTTLVDDIKVRVTYVPATRLVYIRDAAAAAPTDIEARVVHYTVDTGNPTTDDTAGILTLQIGDAEYQGTSAGKARKIGIGEEIRTAAGGGGALLAKTTGEDVPTSLPCGAAIDAKAAKWVFKLANYYADPDAQMAFGVNGTEFAFMYDEQYSVRIRTGRRQDLDTPRHIAHHLNFVHFGFNSGDVITSATFRPLTVDPALGSQLRNVGEPVTGLDTMSGQTLGVWTDRATRGFQGNSPLNYVPIVISPAVGAIEYTVANLAGTPMWTSARGVESAATVSAYGDFVTDPLTLAVQQWVQERVQFDSRIGLIDKRPSMAVAVRSKRQYRLYFRDGYVLTVTLFGAEDVPMCTIQRIERGEATAPYRSSPIRHIFAGIRDDGKETIVGTFERQNPSIIGNEANGGAYPYAAMFDVGTTFARQVIPAYIELNPIYASIPTQDQQWQYVVTWVSGQPRTNITQYSIQQEDVPFVSPSNPIDEVLQPDATATYLPFPNYEIRFDVGRFGPFLRLRYDTSQFQCESHRFTHMVLTNEPQMLHRA